MPGGFFGVDVFFVISGFLITGILISELQTTGRFSVLSFYERRARRILPALFAVVFASVIAGWFLMLTDQFKVFLQSVVSILYFGSNYFFLAHTGYFDANIDLNPMVHTWSLAIEEQFYLFFPIVLWLVWRFVPTRFRWGVLTLLALLSFQVAATWAGDPSASFYLLQFRAWELLAGALVAYLLSRRNFEPLPNHTLGLLGLFAIMFSVFFVGNQFPHPGFITLVPVLGAALVIATTDGSTIAGKLLAWKPLVGIGLISYSTYLWHQPIFSFFRISQTHQPEPLAFLPWIGISIVLAYLSWRFVENPVRNRKRFNRRIIFAATAVVSASVLVVCFVASRPAVSNVRVSPNTGVNYASLAHVLDANRGLSVKCRRFVGSDSHCASGPNPSVLLWGDSYAMSLAQALTHSATKLNFSQQTLSACSPVLGLAHQNPSYGRVQGNECIRENDQVFQWLSSQSNISLVVLASPWDDALNSDKMALNRAGTVTKNNGAGIEALKQTVAKIRALGKQVVVVSPQAKNTEDTGNCLVRAKLNGQSLSNCDYPVTHNQLANVFGYLQRATGGVGLFNLKDLLCSNQCFASAGDVFIYRDYGHFTKAGSAYVGEKFNLMGRLQQAAR